LTPALSVPTINPMSLIHGGDGRVNHPRLLLMIDHPNTRSGSSEQFYG
jgi:hypothetical protein